MKVRLTDNARDELREIYAKLGPRSSMRRALKTELRELTKLLATSPEIGLPFGSLGDLLVRRSYLEKAVHHAYYVVTTDAVEILSIWYAAGGTTPRFGGATH